MATATLTIDLDALISNWRTLNDHSASETAAVVKADGYGLGADRVARALMRAGVRRFFVAVAEEGAALRNAIGEDAEINVFSGHMAGDTDMIGDLGLTPMLNSMDQIVRHVEALPGHPFGVQLDTGMNRLGLEATEWEAVRDLLLSQNPTLVMSHLACADDPSHPMNGQQLTAFRAMTDGIAAPRSLAATGGILLGPDYHFDLTRPGVGLYGGFPFTDAAPVANLSIPVIQIRDVAEGETVGYSNTWTAARHSRIATISAGYADGLIRAMGHDVSAFSGTESAPVIGRISMDLIGIDITDLSEEPNSVELLNATQTVDTLADAAGTIGYEILTSLGHRYARRYKGA
ncbi:alanine racemase [Shimia abyssi]|uniref:Alanine racemase n=1 Tax=Shimia abyssi TaxID=1662395 RepID=A0A2P8FK02_9RHOB|nr:alanine racemase [Shimia abyssi]PSL22018.1 alanine racemase [Shimia abyssi]